LPPALLKASADTVIASMMITSAFFIALLLFVNGSYYSRPPRSAINRIAGLLTQS
jgi:hypothetical protein